MLRLFLAGVVNAPGYFLVFVALTWSVGHSAATGDIPGVGVGGLILLAYVYLLAKESTQHGVKPDYDECLRRANRCLKEAKYWAKRAQQQEDKTDDD